MRTVIELNETDIALIIADKYKCDINDVVMAVKVTTKGYGMAEHKTYECQAKVVTDKDRPPFTNL